MWLLQLLCTPTTCLRWSFANFGEAWANVAAGFSGVIPAPFGPEGFVTVEATAVVLGWLLFQVSADPCSADRPCSCGALPSGRRRAGYRRATSTTSSVLVPCVQPPPNRLGGGALAPS